MSVSVSFRKWMKLFWFILKFWNLKWMQGISFLSLSCIICFLLPWNNFDQCFSLLPWMMSFCSSDHSWERIHLVPADPCSCSLTLVMEYNFCSLVTQYLIFFSSHLCSRDFYFYFLFPIHFSYTDETKIMQLLREITHENVVKLVNVHINSADMSLYLAFDYAEHDLYVSICLFFFLCFLRVLIHIFCTICILYSVKLQ